MLWGNQMLKDESNVAGGFHLYNLQTIQLSNHYSTQRAKHEIL
jgi:hypothetical protein